MNQRKSAVILGAQWGDEGKGKIVDVLSEKFSVVARYAGGHNGAHLQFGPDGCLYISTGDGGDAFPPDGRNTGQDISDLEASILRIDVDHRDAGLAYRIPTDNPFVGQPKARGEIWAFGIRNTCRDHYRYSRLCEACVDWPE